MATEGAAGVAVGLCELSFIIILIRGMSKSNLARVTPPNKNKADQVTQPKRTQEAPPESPEKLP